MAPLRVLWVIKGLGPGGAERLLVSLAGALKGDDIELACAYLLPWKSHLVPELEAAGVAVTCLNVGREYDLRWVLRLRKLARRFSPDVVHFHSPFVAGLARPALRQAGWRAGPSLVTTEHNVFSSYAPLTQLVDRATWRLDAAHLAVTAEARESLPKGLRQATEVVVHGVPLDATGRRRRERERIRAELGFRETDVVVGTIANYRAQKDYPTLLRASAIAIEEAPTVRFVAVGQGPLEAEVNALHRTLGLGDRFVLTGYRPDAVDVLAGCDVFCIASRYEGYPVALMEALALGLPVVGTRVGGVAEAVRDGVEGRLVEPGDPQALAQAVLSVAASDDERVAMGVAAGARARMYDISRAATRHRDLYAALGTP